MPIVIVQGPPGSSHLEAVCDHSGNPIARAADGNYYWDSGDEKSGARIYLAHKHCSFEFERATKPQGSWAALELSEFPVRLAANLDLPVETEASDTPGMVRYTLSGEVLSL